MDLTQIAAELVKYVGPFLPTLLEAGKATREKLAKDAGEALAEDGLETARSLWKRLLPSAQKKPAAIEAAEDVAEDPANADAQGALRQQLKKLLAEDPQLVIDLKAMLAAAEPPPATYHAALHGSGAIAQGPGAVAAGQRGVAIGGAAKGNVIVTGDDAAVEQGKPEGS